MDRGEIKLWQGDCAASEANYPQYWRILSQCEQQHALTIKNAQIHRRYVEVRARLRILLGDVINAAPEQLRLQRAEHGKPYLVDYPDLAFNLSHTANKMVVAMGFRCDIGIDIEQYKARANLASLVDKCFAEEEKVYWQQLPESQQLQAFYHFWVRKEAFVKATGKGIALGLNQCVVNPQNRNEFLRIPEAYGVASEWHIQDIAPGESMCGALAIKNKANSHYLAMDMPICIHSLPDGRGKESL